ncbi:hypothetical protein QJS10_CPA05g00018 [Acorus calamus]|uniref:Uncharacterized protein n=1 Tax=Acorus calamus TaxID=4465 RepID=A0AAV9ESM6_ACOCL|nr:hypothetical protein QJS10_CPA05g00018 [Acorus calamus]
MPTLSTIALERLLEPSTRNSSTPPPEPQKDKYDENGSSAVPVKRPSRRIFISPALYATPKPTPIPGYPTCVSPSPYVVNHKHRRPPPDEPAGRHNGFQVPPSQNPHFNPSIELKKDKKKLGEEEEEVEGEISCEHMEGFGAERDEDLEGSLSVDTTCSSDMGDGGSLGRGGSFGRQTLFSSLTEFYDAAEEFISDSSTSQSPSLGMKFETELHSMRLNLLEEIERRKKSEETLGLMQNYWRGIIKHLTPLGISFPETFLDENTPFEQIQKLAVTKFISEAIRKAEACAEIEAIIDAKIMKLSGCVIDCNAVKM